MNNKGFSLIELISAMIILAAIFLIAIPVVGEISKGIKSSQRKNDINNIEIAATKYAFDTGKTLIFVDELIKEGYLEVNGDSDDLIDHVDNSRLNCHIIEMTKKGNYYEASFKEDKYEKNGKCDESKLNINTSSLAIDVSNDGSIINYNENDWLTGSVTLVGYLNGSKVDCLTNECIWTNNKGLKVRGTNELSISVDNKVLNATYKLQVIINDDGINKYTSIKKIKIDNENPSLSNKTIYTKKNIVDNEVKSINVTIEPSDGSGSGINGYYINTDNGQSCIGVDYQNKNTFKELLPGNYLVCFKDKVGHIGSYNMIINENYTIN